MGHRFTALNLPGRGIYIHRQRYLESRGWRIIRIWSRDWWRNPKAEIDKIKSYLNNYRLQETEKDLELAVVGKKDKPKKMPAKKDKNLKVIKGQGLGDKREKSVVNSAKGSTTIGYGDTVTIKDLDTGETFEISLESNPANRNLMRNIEQRLLGLQVNNRFSFSNFRYQVVDVKKSSYAQ